MNQEIIEGYKLSPQQQNVWELQQLSPGLHAQCAILVEGPLMREVLQNALQQLCERHEALRTAFRLLPGLDMPLQVIVDLPATPLRLIDYSALDDARRGDALSALYAEERDTPFDLQSGRVLRAALVTLGVGRHLLLLTLPALCADAASLANVFGQLPELYGDALRSELSEHEVIQYADFSEWQNELLDSAESLPGREFWEARRQLATPTVRLPLERPCDDAAARPAQNTLTVSLDAELVGALEGLARERTLGAESLLLAGWQGLLWRLTGEPEVSFETAFDGRKFSHLAGAVGPFRKYIPLRAEFAEDLSYGELAAATDESLRAAHARQEHFVQAGGQFERAEAIGFDYEQWPEPTRAGGLSWSLDSLTACAEPFKLRLRATSSASGLRLSFHYDGARFDREAVSRLAEQYLTLLRSAASTPDAPLGTLPLVGEGERRLLLEEWQGERVEFTHTRCLHQLVEERAMLHPGRAAVVYEDEELTFAELNARANQLARRLRESGVGPDTLVGILMERGTEAVVALLGVMKAGGAYLPLDPAYPRERIAFMLEDADAPVLLTQQHLLAGLPGLRAEVIALDSEWGAVSRLSGENLQNVTSPAALAYVIYTSGSTGRPKGVMIRHRSALNLLAALERAVYSRHEGLARVSVNAPLSFDASVKQVIQLARGRTLCVVPELARRDGAELLRYVSEQRVDVLDCTPSQLRLMEAAPEAAEATGQSGEQYPAVALVGGEAIDSQLWGRLAADPRTAYYNVYGPTECTVDATSARVSSEHAAPTIGRPLANVRALVLDARGQLAPVGASGELCVGGEGVARGYLRRDELTREKFIPDPFSDEHGARLYRTGDLARWTAGGVLEYLGRIDRQVKLRGYRIEPGEVEAAVASHPSVRECAVLAREDEPGDTRLVAYFVPRAGAAAEPAAGRPSRYRLPDGTEVAHRNHNETAYLYQEIFARRSYLRHGVTLPEGSCVFDVGANIGMFSLFARRECPTARVHAFEPLSSIRETLSENASLLGSGVKVHACGLSDAERDEEFTFYDRYTMMSGASAHADAASEVEVIRSFLRRESELGAEGAAALLEHAEGLLEGRFEGRGEVCRLRRLGDVLREQGVGEVTLLKVDVQRAELEVLEGVEEGQWAGIRQVAMEVHDGRGEASEGRCGVIRRMLEARGYRVEVEQEAELEGTDRYNLYAVQEGWDGTGAYDRGGAWPAGEEAAGVDVAVAEGLREYVRGRLPEYMLPSAYVELARLPLTRHGKVDWEALPAPEEVEGAGREGLQAPRTPAEEVLAGIFAEVLRVREVGVDENFFELGGHSLLATQLVSRVREAFGVEVTLRKLFEGPTVAELGAHVESLVRGARGVTAPAMGRAARGGPLPVSFAQRRLWFIDQLEGGSAFYNSPAAVRLSGQLNVEALGRTLSEVVRRHEVLRTHFAEVEGEPVQVITPAEPLGLPVTDLSGMDEERREDEVRRLSAEEARSHFNLKEGPLVRAKLLRLSEEEHVVLLTMHHIVTDGWSIGVLVREVAALYEAYVQGLESPLPELELQYADYAAWQRGWLQGEVLEEQVSYWRKQLGGKLPVLELPTDRPRPAVQTFRGSQITFRLRPDVAEGVRELSRREGVTLFMTLLAAFQVLLSRYTNQEDVVVGSAIAGRNRKEIEPLIGFFINTLVLRTDVGGNPSFRELVGRVREVTLSAYAHQDVPFEKLVEELQPERSLSHTPLSQVTFGVQNVPAETLELPGLRLSPVGGSNEVGRFDLTVWVAETAAGMQVRWSYNTDLFDAERVERMQRHFEQLLASATAEPEARLNALDMLSAAEKEEREAKRKQRKESNTKKLRGVQRKPVPQAEAELITAEP